MPIGFASKRLGKELAKIHQSLPPGITLVSADDFKEWLLDIKVLDANPLYQGQTYRLKFAFSPNYPIEPPEVTFLRIEPRRNSNSKSTSSNPPLTSTSTSNPNPSAASTTTTTSTPLIRPIPIHPHIYSNGIICLDLLGIQGWSPIQNVESVCMSLQSMLTGNTKNERPEGDEEFVKYNKQRPRDIHFAYHDDEV